MAVDLVMVITDMVVDLEVSLLWWWSFFSYSEMFLHSRTICIKFTLIGKTGWFYCFRKHTWVLPCIKLLYGNLCGYLKQQYPFLFRIAAFLQFPAKTPRFKPF